MPDSLKESVPLFFWSDNAAEPETWMTATMKPNW
jgi:hypothetical protein